MKIHSEIVEMYPSTLQGWKGQQSFSALDSSCGTEALHFNAFDMCPLMDLILHTLRCTDAVARFKLIPQNLLQPSRPHPSTGTTV